MTEPATQPSAWFCSACAVTHPDPDDETRMRCPKCGSVDEDGEDANVYVEVPTTFSFGPTCQWGQMPDGEEAVDEGDLWDTYVARCNNGACAFAGTVKDFRDAVSAKEAQV